MSQELIPVGDIDPKRLFRALWESAKSGPMAFVHANRAPKTEEAWDALFTDLANEARVDGGKRFFYVDYLFGRVMKIEIPCSMNACMAYGPARLKRDMLDPRLYDRDSGDGACLRIVENLRASQIPLEEALAAEEASQQRLDALEDGLDTMLQQAASKA